MSLRVLKPGLQTTVQDLGRPNHQIDGFPTSGVMDQPAAITANLLVGNPASAAVLEFFMAGPTVEFTVSTFIALGTIINLCDGYSIKYIRIACHKLDLSHIVYEYCVSRFNHQSSTGDACVIRCSRIICPIARAVLILPFADSHTLNLRGKSSLRSTN